jgi:hypothetical protein
MGLLPVVQIWSQVFRRDSNRALDRLQSIQELDGEAVRLLEDRRAWR